MFCCYYYFTGLAELGTTKGVNMINETQIAHECIAMSRECNSSWEILEYVRGEGYPYKMAVNIVTRALRLDDDEVFEMEDRYRDCV